MARGSKRAGRLRVGAAAMLSAAALVMMAVVPESATAQSPAATTAVASPELGEPSDPVVKAAATLIRARFPSMPRIYVVDPAAMHVRTSWAGFRIWYGDRLNPNVFVNKLSRLYRDARGGDTCALKSLAAVLAHEITHSYTRDEAETSRVELSVLDGFMTHPSIGLSEHVCLMVRKETVRLHGGIK